MEEALGTPVINDLTMVLGSISQALNLCYTYKVPSGGELIIWKLHNTQQFCTAIKKTFQLFCLLMAHFSFLDQLITLASYGILNKGKNRDIELMAMYINMQL
ncbi:hypothetical protein Tco_0148051 [Tanacetum coccineum]